MLNNIIKFDNIEPYPNKDINAIYDWLKLI